MGQVNGDGVVINNKGTTTAIFQENGIQLGNNMVVSNSAAPTQNHHLTNKEYVDEKTNGLELIEPNTQGGTTYTLSEGEYEIRTNYTGSNPYISTDTTILEGVLVRRSGDEITTTDGSLCTFS